MTRLVGLVAISGPWITAGLVVVGWTLLVAAALTTGLLVGAAVIARCKP